MYILHYCMYSTLVNEIEHIALSIFVPVKLQKNKILKYEITIYFHLQEAYKMSTVQVYPLPLWLELQVVHPL